MYTDVIKYDRIQAMKKRDTKMKQFLDVVLGEITSAEVKADLTDSEIEKIINKMKQNAVDMRTKYGQDTQHEIDYFTALLPSVISDDELKVMIIDMIKNDTDLQSMNVGRMTGAIIKQLGVNDVNFNRRSVSGIIATLTK